MSGGPAQPLVVVAITHSLTATRACAPRGDCVRLPLGCHFLPPPSSTDKAMCVCVCVRVCKDACGKCGADAADGEIPIRAKSGACKDRSLS